MQRRGRQRSMIATGGLLALGLLFWARLIVVSDLPRMAVADPERGTAGTPSDNAPNPNRAIDEKPDRSNVQGTTNAHAGNGTATSERTSEVGR